MEPGGSTLLGASADADLPGAGKAQQEVGQCVAGKLSGERERSPSRVGKNRVEIQVEQVNAKFQLVIPATHHDVVVQLDAPVLPGHKGRRIADRAVQPAE